MSNDHFDILLLIARPGAGKSEVIDYLKNTPVPERQQRFHIGKFEELDDFPMLWTWFEEDSILESMGYPRIHSDAKGYFKHPYQWDLLIHRLCLNYAKLQRDKPNYHDETTTILEFARGSQHGGFQRAFDHLSKQVIERMVVLYINVSWEESLRKNRARYNPERPDSILEHGLPDDKLEKLYKDSDWEIVSAGSSTHLGIQGIRVPYAVMENEDDVTTERGPALGERLQDSLNLLWERYNS